jgi:hypothetical protein
MSAKLDINFKGILEERLPSREVDFISHKLVSLLPKIRNSSLREKLLTIASIFSDQGYGCEEAILSGKSMRWPSEIKNQRYCGEQALANFVLTRALGLQSILVTTEDFKSRGMDHDVVLIPERNHFLMLDWHTIHPVLAKGPKLLDGNSNKVLSNNAFSLRDEHVFDRIENVRRKPALEALGNLELLTREITPDGEIEALYGYNPEKNELTFEYTSSVSSTPLSFYYLQRIHQNGSLNIIEEAGIISKKQGYKYTRIPLVNLEKRNLEILKKAFFSPHKLDEETKREIYLSVLYDSEKEDFTGGFIFNGRERDSFLKFLKKTAQHGSSKKERSSAGRQSEFYNFLARTHSEESAERYIDFLCFKAGFLAVHSQDFYPAFWAITGIPSSEVSGRFIINGLERIRRGYFEGRDDNTSAERVLFQQFTGRNYSFPKRELISRLLC